MDFGVFHFDTRDAGRVLRPQDLPEKWSCKELYRNQASVSEFEFTSVSQSSLALLSSTGSLAVDTITAACIGCIIRTGARITDRNTAYTFGYQVA